MIGPSSSSSSSSSSSPRGGCPKCEYPRVSGPECARCGVIYAKARPDLPPGQGGLELESAAMSPLDTNRSASLEAATDHARAQSQRPDPLLTHLAEEVTGSGSRSAPFMGSHLVMAYLEGVAGCLLADPDRTPCQALRLCGEAGTKARAMSAYLESRLAREEESAAQALQQAGLLHFHDARVIREAEPDGALAGGLKGVAAARRARLHGRRRMATALIVPALLGTMVLLSWSAPSFLTKSMAVLGWELAIRLMTYGGVLALSATLFLSELFWLDKIRSLLLVGTLGKLPGSTVLWGRVELALFCLRLQELLGAGVEMKSAAAAAGAGLRHGGLAVRIKEALGRWEPGAPLWRFFSGWAPDSLALELMAASDPSPAQAHSVLGRWAQAVLATHLGRVRLALRVTATLAVLGLLGFNMYRTLSTPILSSPSLIPSLLPGLSPSDLPHELLELMDILKEF